VKSVLWRTSPASTELEEVVLDWLRQMIGLDRAMSGIIYDTASVSSMHAIAAAREGVELRIREEGMSGRKDLPLLRVYASRPIALFNRQRNITLGLGQRALRKIPSDSEFRMDVKRLREAIDEDKRDGFLPFCVVATVGTTFNLQHRFLFRDCESLRATRDVAARRRGVWRGRPRLFPRLRTSSTAVNAQTRWCSIRTSGCSRLSIYQCFIAGTCIFLVARFRSYREYLRTPEQANVRSGSDYGVQLGRRFRALKLWMIIRYFGHEGLAGAHSRACRLAQLFASW